MILPIETNFTVSYKKFRTHIMRNSIFLLIFLFILSSCQKEDSNSTNSSPDPNIAIKDLVVSPNFDFRTDALINLNISDEETYRVKYTVFAAFDGQLEEKIASIFPQSTSTQAQISVPTFCKRIKIIRNANGVISTIYANISGNAASAIFTKNSGKAMNCSETLYAVNGQGGFYTIDVESGDYSATTMPNLAGGGSIACAVDQEQGIMYYNTGTTLRYYDYNAGTFHVAQNGNPFNGNYPRMEYNYVDSLLYIANDNNKMYTIDPLTNQIVNNYNIVGLDNKTGGDIAISKDSTIYMCTFSGLYRIALNGNTANATRISAENLPFQPTSMAIDRNDRLYIATNDAKSKLIEMDKYDGAWSVVGTYPHKINDLGSYKCAVADLANIDSDNDGVIDALDDFPNDPSAAEAKYTPSDIGWGSLAFEDLWPSQGDFDFNDLVINYRFTQIANAANKVVRLEGKFRIKAIGASFRNGFGFKINVDPNLISTVSGFNLTENYINLDGKGIETGHSSGSTIIVFDDAYDNIQKLGNGQYVNTEQGQPISVGDEINVIITFTNPIDPALLGSAPFNPFLIVDGNRGRELHLAGMAPTDLMDLSIFNTLDDDSDLSSQRYYRTENNLPWAINVIHEFRYPEEEKAINTAYNFFNAWAQSSGNSYSDWYKDNAGYRNTANIILN